MHRRIAMIGALPPYRGGIAHFATSTWQCLVDRGHEVLGVSFSRQYPGLLFPGKTQYEPEPVATPDDVHRWIDSVLPWTWERAARRISRWRADTLLFHHWMPFFAPSYGTIARRVDRGVRKLAVVHNAIPHERRPFDHALNRWFFQRCDGFVVLSEEVEADLRTLGVDAPIERIHHPIYDRFGPPPSRSEARTRLALTDDAPVLLFFGYVRAYKGLEVLLDALARARRELPELRLIIAGEFYEDRAKYEEQIAQLGIKNAVDLRAHYLSDEEVAICFSAADAVVQPYVTATQSGVAQVAFHFETPMILTDVGGLAEIVPDGEAGLVVPARDVNALSDAILRFYREDLRERLAAGVRARKDLFSWDRLGEAVERLCY